MNTSITRLGGFSLYSTGQLFREGVGFRRKAARVVRLLHMVFFGAVLFTPIAVRASDSSDRWETLQAIHMVENPTNSTRVGRAGELGPYQFRPATWRMHTKKPFHLAADRAEADKVAVKHYEWIKRNLERAGVQATSFRIALAWNAGLDAALQDRAPRSSRHYAARVQAIAEDLQKQQVAGEQ
ncbi:MAG TPA: hypothetical protein VFT72_13685 [Opitutaceae bacterium]|nr:hypothetical protein [Opitutaceae bacterium]